MEKGKQSKENRGRQLQFPLHFWSTFRSPFSTCYTPFQISGSKKSNASNGARFGVKMKELQPLMEADHSKLKENFARLQNHPFAAKMLSFCCENFIAILHSAMEFLLKLPNRLFEIFFFRYLMSKSPNSPCNPPIIGFHSL